MMTLAVTLGLKSCQVDYTNAFIQETLNPGEEVYMVLLRGWEQPGKVLKLKRLVYGLAQAPLAWFSKLKKGLEDTGFRSSTMGLCLFISDKVICAVYVDDCLMFAKDIVDIDHAIQHMIDAGFQLRVQGDAVGFLEIKLNQQDDGSIDLKQTALIQRIIDILGFQNANGKATPAKGSRTTSRCGWPRASGTLVICISN
eukprot:11162258-Ditylum_brightwellii.AAC.1